MVCIMINGLYCDFVKDCVEQPFDTPSVFVSKNPNLAEEFAVSIRDYLMELEARIGNIVCSINGEIYIFACIMQYMHHSVSAVSLFPR